MRSHKIVFATAVLVAMAMPVAAQAADAIAVRSGTMRAGPDSDFPSVEHISKGENLQVYGCTDGYSWCDVSNGDNRGWYPGSRIAFYRDGRQEILPEVGAAVGIGIVGFAVEEYWGAHYHNRPFFRQEQTFQGRYHGPGGPGPGPVHNPGPVVNQPHNPPHVNPPLHTNPTVVQHPNVQHPNTPHIPQTNTTPHGPVVHPSTPHPQVVHPTVGHPPASPGACHAKGCVTQ